jgi:hypothetical protein
MGVLFPRATKVLRSSDGRYVNGIWQEPERTEIIIRADVQSYMPSETKQPPPGWQQGMSAIVIYTSENLIIASAEKKNSGDVIFWMNKHFRVMTREPRPYLIPHTKYLGLEEIGIGEENI